jgi:glutathione synthase/RimK-type ligase-like ATP-grasp enzyme
VQIIIVTDEPSLWPFEMPGVTVVDAWSYLTSGQHSNMRGVKIFNLCRSYRYQTAGYYVSLLAEARAHRPLPSVTTMQDIQSPSMVRLLSGELDDLIQKSLNQIHANNFTLSIYFGRNTARKYDRLSLHLFNLFQAPLLRAQFFRDQDGWQLGNVRAIAADEVPESHRPFLLETAEEHFAGRRGTVRKKTSRFDLAILQDPKEEHSPSDELALKRFVKAGERAGFSVELIERDDYARLAEFDALFIRETTHVNHHTYRFARRAAQEGLVVIDDPQSIVRCTNKVYLAELMTRHKLPTPKTLVVNRDNRDAVAQELGLPCVLKQPDSAFSLGVVKAETEEELNTQLDYFLSQSELVVAQEFIASTFDWRIGILDQKPIYACKYHMAKKHWQIVRRDEAGHEDYGKFETMPVETAPRKAVSIAKKAANLIGNGLYGVDVKQSGNDFYIIEVNDNPNLDSGVEDAILHEELYDRIMRVFLDRVERKKAGI